MYSLEPIIFKIEVLKLNSYHLSHRKAQFTIEHKIEVIIKYLTLLQKTLNLTASYHLKSFILK